MSALDLRDLENLDFGLLQGKASGPGYIIVLLECSRSRSLSLIGCFALFGNCELSKRQKFERDVFFYFSLCGSVVRGSSI